MAVPAIGDLLLITFRNTLFSQRLMNTFWYNIKTVNITNTPTIETLSNQIFTAMGPGTGFFTTYRACLGTDLMIDQMWVQKIFPTRIMKEVLDVNLAGNGAGAYDTANVQGSIMRRTEVARPGNIGGIRLPLPTGEDWQIQGKLGGVALTNYSALAANMDNEWTLAVGTVIEPVLPTRDPPVPPKKQGIINGSRDLARFEVMKEVRTMSRRTVGRGE